MPFLLPLLLLLVLPFFPRHSIRLSFNYLKRRGMLLNHCLPLLAQIVALWPSQRKRLLEEALDGWSACLERSFWMFWENSPLIVGGGLERNTRFEIRTVAGSVARNSLGRLGNLSNNGIDKRVPYKAGVSSSVLVTSV